MLKRILARSNWKQLSTFITPAFFDVVSTRQVLARAQQVRMSPDAPSYRTAISNCAETLSSLPLQVVLKDDAHPSPDNLPQDNVGDAARITTLYFHQLFATDTCLLDLRGSSFRRNAGALHWTPAPWVCTFAPDFLQPLRAIYRGFYSDDPALFHDGLAGLEIECAEDLFRKHFGGEQREQRFVTSAFVETFSQVFQRCREAGVRLHPDFALLGAYLAGLYENLEGRGVAVDVRACFERATAGHSGANAQAEHSDGLHVHA